MKKLIKTITEIKNISISLEFILQEEYNILLNPETCNNINTILKPIEKKTMLFKKFVILNEDRLSLEKKYSIFAPYKNVKELNNSWNKIIEKLFLLREFNLKNKILINKKLFLNQYFLELFATHNKAITYDFKGDLKI
ncbi:flagellar export chaperone FlgN [Buchnera aphidicola]|uniref:Flagellar biosynthesis protein FlgN n=1 Tax=Buchnera aphidicola (Macrosiphum gaurae) TaxID=2315801 RepID=A0A4D6Y1W2_9GAMM|nr:flagellar export chaperone FlgN [Buchnera aphidicola]QCI22779.1 flagellar biosynthesis protein FlgN [Buchnera aphidicola (Macrosiphum gaurae)]